MEEINILIYTDYDFTLNPADDFGLTTLRDLILERKPKNAVIKFSLINRNTDSHADKKLTTELLSEFDQLWVFGFYQADFQSSTGFDPEHGGPYNELDDNEVAALEGWMMGPKCGGILITGDHSEEKQKCGHDPDLPDALGLGRALGHRIPRAGKMRAWDGPPFSFGLNSFNTNWPVDTIDLGNTELEKDSEPQHIYVSTNEEAPFHPHELFLGRRLTGGGLRRIQVFPDHTHEGKLEIHDWPAGFSPPVEVAWGFDNRFKCPRISPIVSVYDGEQDSVGRIVADSTWHHYTNVNVNRLPREGALGLIGDYYGNLAYWLTPKDKRDRIKTGLFPWLARHPLVAEVATGNYWLVGTTAKSVVDSEFQSYEAVGLSSLFIPQEFLKLPPVLVDLAQVIIIGHCIKRAYEKDLVGSLAAYPELLEECLKEALQAGLKDFGTHIESLNNTMNSMTDVAGPSDGPDSPDKDMPK